MKIILIILLFLPIISFSDSISIYMENDILWDMDGFYTHGTEIKYNNDKYWGFTLSQLIYTPSNKDSDQPQYGDRPYCGELKLQIYKNLIKKNNIDDFIGLTLGIIGPASLADKTQIFVHDLFNNAKPMGWDYQLYNEPIINLAYYKSFSYKLINIIEIKPLTGINLGNELTDLEAGNIIRMGYNMPNYFAPFISTFEETTRFRPNQIGIYGFIGVIGKLKVYDITLDGNLLNTKENYVTVDKKKFVAQGFYGLSLIMQNIEIIYTHIEMTEEFVNQPRDNRYDSLQIKVNF